MKIYVYMLSIIIGLGILVISWIFQKDKMSSLVMPGPLVMPHAKYENECFQCHSSFDKTNQDNLCMNCHKEINQDIRSGAGFHGHFPAVKENQCKSCHSDHKGRDAKIIYLDKEIFDHKFTDFPLLGAHEDTVISCDACHIQGKKFREAPSECSNCHTKDDVHKGKLGATCNECHKPTNWKDTYFDHGQTEFALEGKHKNVTCDACHMNNLFENTPKDCVSCHLINDAHDSPIDAKCEQCHSSNGWDKVAFDHDRLTEFTLKDKHAAIECEACHTNLLFKNEVGSKCIDCHLSNDIHKGMNGTRCDECHQTQGWKEISFDHNKDTKFPLLGKHEQVTCESCHQDDTREKKLEKKCINCHIEDDVHQGQNQDCSACHSENGWSEKIRFDHDLTPFPLIGMHAAIACEECHLTSAFKSTESQCISCHVQDDVHNKTLGTDCGKCHNPNDWRLWEFDHNVQTDFVLDGAHQELLCKSCHTASVEGEIKMNKDCYDCHVKDNVHGGKYQNLGKRCDLCHTTTLFDVIVKDKIKEFHYNPLKNSVNLSENCQSCHNNDDVHNGKFGRQCDRCHSVQSWEEIIIGR